MTTATPPPRRRTQAERSATSERRILEAARELIAGRGSSRATMSDIGREAGYSGSLVSHRFGSKEGLIRTLVRRMSGRFLDGELRPAMAGRSGIEALCAQVDVYLDTATLRASRVRALHVLMGEALGPVRELAPLFVRLDRDVRRRCEEVLERAVRNGELAADLPIEATAVDLTARLRGVTQQWLLEPGCFDLDAVREHIKSSLRRELAAASD